MILISFTRMGWKDLWSNLILSGKIILFPMFILFSIGMIALSPIEFIIFDIPMLVIAAFHKDEAVKGMINYLLNREEETNG